MIEGYNSHTEVKCNFVSSKYIYITCPFCYTINGFDGYGAYKKNGQPRKHAVPLCHKFGNGLGTAEQRIETRSRSGHCNWQTFEHAGIQPEFAIVIDNNTKTDIGLPNGSP